MTNEWFARDTSKKVRAIKRAQGMAGKHIAVHPLYGYKKDTDAPEKRIIDDEAAEIVRRIFRMTISGKGPYEIATIPEKEHILCPSAYLAERSAGNRRNNEFANPLTGLLYCADCGARLYNERGENGKGHFKDSYACSSYRKRTSDCTMHFIRSEVVRDLILSALHSISEYAKANCKAFERLVMDTTSDRQSQQMKESRKALTDGQRRYDELDVLIQHTYEDPVAGKLTDKRFLKLSQQSA